MKKIIIPIDHLYEDMELQYPKYRLLEAGVEVALAGKQKEQLYKGKHGYPDQSTTAFSEVSADDWDGIIIPGGYAPDKLRQEDQLLQLIQALHEQKKLIAFICHAGWILVSAGVLKGVKCTSYKGIKDDIINAGANWVDQEVVVDGHLISSRTPKDLPAFSKAILKFLQLS